MEIHICYKPTMFLSVIPQTLDVVRKTIYLAEPMNTLQYRLQIHLTNLLSQKQHKHITADCLLTSQTFTVISDSSHHMD